MIAIKASQVAGIGDINSGCVFDLPDDSHQFIPGIAESFRD
jgi:hypothetical protein